MDVSLSVLDLVPVGTGATAGEALRSARELALLAERLGFERYWFAEHHGLSGIASSSPEVLIAHVASATERIRVGSGGIMLRNHVPLRVAETFHTLEALHPGRIDLGIGRAPGADPWTARALRRNDPERFPEQLQELIALSGGSIPERHPLHGVRVVPTGVELPPIWLLGSSGASARLAGELGVGYAFASHFSPAPPGPAIRDYLESFRPSQRFPEPRAILGVSVICAESEERANYLATSSDLAFIRFQNGRSEPLPSPEEATAYPYTAFERSVAAENRARGIVGTPAVVRDRIERLVRESGTTEVMVMTMIHGHRERLRSYELVAEAFGLAVAAE